MLRRLNLQCLTISEFSACKQRLSSKSLTYNSVKTISIGVTSRQQSYRHDDSSAILPSQSQIVIAGAGTVANSVAYHLVLNGWNDVLVLEQNKIGDGTSHFGSGMVGLFKPLAHRNLISYSIKLYRQLQEMGYNIGFRQCGSINLAQTKDRMIALKRRMAYNVPTGLHCEVSFFQLCKLT